MADRKDVRSGVLKNAHPAPASPDPGSLPEGPPAPSSRLSLLKEEWLFFHYFHRFDREEPRILPVFEDLAQSPMLAHNLPKVSGKYSARAEDSGT
jgi:hypothetical protein